MAPVTFWVKCTLAGAYEALHDLAWLTSLHCLGAGFHAVLSPSKRSPRLHLSHSTQLVRPTAPSPVNLSFAALGTEAVLHPLYGRTTPCFCSPTQAQVQLINTCWMNKPLHIQIGQGSRWMKPLTCHTADQELRSFDSTPALSIKLPNSFVPFCP